MSDRFDQNLFLKAGEERLKIPYTLEDKIESLLADLPEKKNVYKMNLRKVVVLAAALTMLLSVTVTASVGIMRERMEAMNQAKLEEFFNQIYKRKIGADNYNRYLTSSEKERKETLQITYEEQGLFPEGELILIDEAGDYRGKGVAYLADTGTFFFPEKEMSDEQLLQIIDFVHKRDYSLQRVNEMIADGDMELSEVLEPVPETMETDPVILESDAIWDPGQELTIVYTGDLTIYAMAAGGTDIYLGGWNAVHRMAIGRSNSQVFYDDFEKETRIDGLYVDNAENVYIVGAEFKAEVNDESHKYLLSEICSWVLWKVDKNGNLLKKIRLDDFSNEEVRMIDKIAVDEQGYIYMHMVDNHFGGQLAILDAEGKLVSRVNSGQYYFCHIGGLGLGKDGKIYTMIGEKGGRKGIATVNREEGTLGDVYMGIIPDEAFMPKIIIPGVESDFILWGYNGIFSYNLGEESAINIHPAYEAPCSFEGVYCCALKDGRIVLVPMADPGKTCFFYQSSLKD